jgi:hypothetical protein
MFGFTGTPNPMKTISCIFASNIWIFLVKHEGRDWAMRYGFDSRSKGLSLNPRRSSFICYMLATYSVFFQHPYGPTRLPKADTGLSL